MTTTIDALVAEVEEMLTPEESLELAKVDAAHLRAHRPSGRYLTPRQLEVLEFIRDTIARLGYAPTLREIAEEFGFSSTASAQKHIALLQKKGYLHRDKNQKRGLVVLV